MAHRINNYSAFYVSEPFSETNLGAYSAKDFVYYNMLRAWKGKDCSFPFLDAHDTTYNVRDNSDWELTLKPRLHQRLRNSKNIILFLSQNTRNSRALRAEIDYGINVLGLTVIVVYPDYNYNTSIVDGNGLKDNVKALWNKLPCLGESSTKNSVYVKYGDMYSPDIVEKGYNGKRAIVVSVNRCFDTIIDDHLVSHNTQHGQVFQKLYDSQKFTPDSLNRTISDFLRRDTVYEDLTVEIKPEGNRKRYIVGTTVNLQIDDNLSYYLLGLSYFDEHWNNSSIKTWKR